MLAFGEKDDKRKLSDEFSDFASETRVKIADSIAIMQVGIKNVSCIPIF